MKKKKKKKVKVILVHCEKQLQSAVLKIRFLNV